MEPDTMLPPPNPDEPFVASSVGDAGPARRRSRAVWLIPAVVVVIGAAVLAGRLTTSGERSALGDERDALLHTRDGLQARVAELEGEALRFESAEEEHLSTIEGLESAAAATEVEMTVLREQAEFNGQRISDLESEHSDLLERVADVEQCRAVSADADAVLAAWEDFFDRFLDYLDTEVGSDAEVEAEQQMEEADVAIEDAEAAMLASATRCESALDAIPECDTDVATLTFTDSAPCPM